MKKNTSFFCLILVFLSLFQFGMSNRGQYDEEAREQERLAKQQRKTEAKAAKNPVKEIASGVKQATYDNAKDVISETAESTTEGAPVAGTLEGARKSTGKVLDNTVKGAAKVATLGYGSVQNYEVEEPEAGSGDTTKVKIKIPGT